MTQPNLVEGGYWREDGTYQSPDGWPDGAGWRVLNADGSIDRSGPASDFQLLATTDTGDDGPMPPARDMGIAYHGAPPQEPQDG